MRRTAVGHQRLFCNRCRPLCDAQSRFNAGLTRVVHHGGIARPRAIPPGPKFKKWGYAVGAPPKLGPGGYSPWNLSFGSWVIKRTECQKTRWRLIVT